MVIVIGIGALYSFVANMATWTMGANRTAQAAAICMLLIIQAIVFLIWVPGEPLDWAQAGPILGGVALTILIGEAPVRTATPEEPDR